MLVFGILLGSAIFSLLGEFPILYGIIVLLFIPLTVVLKVQEGVVRILVVLLMFFNAKSIDAHLIVNEHLLLLIGLSIAFTMNLMMPSLDKQLDEYKCKLSNKLLIFLEIVIFVKNMKIPLRLNLKCYF